MLRHDLPPTDRRTPEPQPPAPDRRPAWVQRLDDRIRVAPERPIQVRVERPIR